MAEAMPSPEPTPPSGTELTGSTMGTVDRTALPDGALNGAFTSQSLGVAAANREESGEEGDEGNPTQRQEGNREPNLPNLSLDRADIALSTQLQLEQLDALQQHVQKQLFQGMSSAVDIASAGEAAKQQIEGETGAPFGVTGNSLEVPEVVGAEGEQARREVLAASKTDLAASRIGEEVEAVGTHFARKGKGWGDDTRLAAAVSGGTTVEEDGENSSSSSVGFSASSPGGQDGNGDDTNSRLPATSGVGVQVSHEDRLRLLVLQQDSVMKQTSGVGLPTALEVSTGGRVTPSASEQTFSSVQFSEDATSPQKTAPLRSLVTGKRTRRGQAPTTASDSAHIVASLPQGVDGEIGKANPSALLFCGEDDPQSSMSTPHGAAGRGQSTEATPSSGTHASSGDRKAKREELEPMKTRRLARVAAAQAAVAAAGGAASDGRGETAAGVKAEGNDGLSAYLASQEGLAASQAALAQSTPGQLATLAGSHPMGLYFDEASAALSGLVVPGVGKGGMPIPGVPGADCTPGAMNAALLPVISTGALANAGAPGAAVPSLLTSDRLAPHPGTAASQVPALAGVNAAPQGSCAPGSGTGEYDRNDLLMRPGVSYYGGRQAWVAEIKYGGRRRFKVFSVAKYGYEGAKQMAVDTRERWEEAREAGELDQLMMSSQRHQCPVQSGVKGVYYDTARKGWRVVVTLNCRQMSKFFLASKFGNAEAKRLAIECRQMWLDAIQNGRADDVFEKARKLVSFKTKGVNSGANAPHNNGSATGAQGVPHVAPVGASVGMCGATGAQAPVAGGLLASRFGANGTGAGAPHQSVGAQGVGGELSHSSSVLLAAASGGAAGVPGGLQPSPSGLLNSSLSSCLGKFGATPATGLSADGTSSSSCLFSNVAGTPSRNLRDASNELLLAAAAANASSAHAGTAALLSGLPGGAVGVPLGAGAGANAGASGDGTSSLAAAAAAAAFLSPSSLASMPRGLRGDTSATGGTNAPGASPTDENVAAGQQAGAAGVLATGATPGGRPSPAFGLAAFSGAAGAPGAGACSTDGGAAATGSGGNAAGAALLAVASQQGFDPKPLQQHQLAEQQLVLQQWGEAAAAVAGGVGIPQTLFPSSSGCADGEGSTNGTIRDPVAVANQHQQLQLQLLQELNRGASLPPLLDVLWGPSVAGAGGATAAAPGDRDTGANQGTEGACGVGENGELVALPGGAARDEAAGGNQSSLLTMGLGGQEEGAAPGEGANTQNGCSISAPVLSLLLQQQGLHHQQLAAAAAAAARGCTPAQPGPGAGALCGFNRDGNMVVLGNPIAGGAPGCLLSGPTSGDNAGADKRGANHLGGALGNASMGAMSGHLAGGTLLGAAGAARAAGNVATPVAGAPGSKRRRTQQGAAVGLQGQAAGVGATGNLPGVSGSRRHQRQTKDVLASGILAGNGVPGGDCPGGKPGAGVGTGSENSTCDVRGVYLDTRNNAWAATMGVHGRNVKKSFAVAKHGYETALQLAIHARRQLERIYWGSSPGDEQDASLLGLSNRSSASAVAGAAHTTPTSGALPSLASPHQATPTSAVPQTLLHAQQPLQSLQGLCWPGPGGIAQAGAAGACARPEDEMTAASMAALRGAILDPASLSRLSGEDAASAEAAARTAVAAGSLLYGTPFGSTLPAGLVASPVVAPPNNTAAEATSGELVAPTGDPRGVVAAAARVRTGGVVSADEDREGAAGAARPGAVAGGMLAGGAGDNLLSPGLGMTGTTAGASSGVLPGGPTLLGSGLEGCDASSLNMANLIAASSSAESSPSGGLIVRDALAALLLQLDPQQRMALLQGDMNSLNSLQTAFLQNSQFFTPPCAPDANQLFVGANATPNAGGPLGAAAPETCSPSLLLGNAERTALGCGVVGLAAGVTEETFGEKQAMRIGDRGMVQVKETNGSSNEPKAEQGGAREIKVEGSVFSFAAGKEDGIQGVKPEEDSGKAEKEALGESRNMGCLPTGNTTLTPIEPSGVELGERQQTPADDGVGLNVGIETREEKEEGSEVKPAETSEAAPQTQEQ